MDAPKKLSSNEQSPYFNAKALKQVAGVFIDGVLIPDNSCYAYDMAGGWAIRVVHKQRMPKEYGKITVTMKTEPGKDVRKKDDT